MSRAIELVELEPIPEETAARLRYDVPASAAFDAMPADLRISQAELEKVMVELVRSLPKNELLVIWAHFWEDKTLAEIAQETKRSRSRVSQILEHALSRMRRPSYSVPIRIAAGWKDEETTAQKVARTCQEMRDEQRRKRDLAEARALKAQQEKEERARVRKEREEGREKFKITKPSKSPPKLVKLQRIIDSLTQQEEQDIKDYMGLCRFKKCGGKANEYGYCHLHTQAVLGRYFLDDDPGYSTIFDALRNLMS